MSDREYASPDNPLDEFADQASRTLQVGPLDVRETTLDRVEGGQVSIQDSFARSVTANATYMENAAAGVVHARLVDVKEGTFGFVTADSISAETIESGIMAADLWKVVR